MFAPHSRHIKTITSGLGNRLLMQAAIPTPVILPNLAQISCMAVIRGKENNMVQSSSSPNWTPACEYVAIPLGSSSAAPVISPGPSLSSIPVSWGPVFGTELGARVKLVTILAETSNVGGLEEVEQPNVMDGVVPRLLGNQSD
jgi:hypothetical protein